MLRQPTPLRAALKQWRNWQRNEGEALGDSLLRSAAEGSACARSAAVASTSAPAIAASAHPSWLLARGASRLASGANAAEPRGFKALLGDLKQLSKFKLSSLVVLTASAGFVAGSGEQLDWAGLAWTSLGTFGAAACANTLNQVGPCARAGD
jgi:hypothetical protein